NLLNTKYPVHYLVVRKKARNLSNANSMTQANSGQTSAEKHLDMISSLSSKAIAISNNDVAFIAWRYDQKIPNCLGFAIYRIDLNSGTTTLLPAWVGFKGQSNPKWDYQTTAIWPIQKFNWRDLTAKKGGFYQYQIVPMTGIVGKLQQE